MEDRYAKCAYICIDSYSLPLILKFIYLFNLLQICNLPDHPIHAGCTSIVVVMIENTLSVANAGDSRAVICHQGGIAEGLSIDHKPMQVSVEIDGFA